MLRQLTASDKDGTDAGPPSGTVRVVVAPVGPLACNCVVVHCTRRKQAVVIDPGGSVDVILETLRDAGGPTVERIVVTHGHLDHFLAAGRLQAALSKDSSSSSTPTTITTSTTTTGGAGGGAGVVASSSSPQQAATKGRPEICLHETDEALWQAWSMQAQWMGVATDGEDHNIPERPDAWLRHGDDIGLGGTVLHTPGHTPGSVCLYFEALNVVATGDTLFCGSVGRTDLPGGDSQQLLDSIHHQLLKPLPRETIVIPGHGNLTTLKQECVTNPYVQSLLARDRAKL